jgi:hypothetical protein
LVKIKEKESNFVLDSNSEQDNGNHRIDAKLSVFTTTKNIQPEESEVPKDGEHLFHSQMWVKGNPLNFIVYSGI